MSKKRNHAGKAKVGRGEAPGTSLRPADLAEEAPQTPECEGKAVPLGLPISAEEYEKLQKESRHRKLPPAGCAQEDTSG